MSSVIEVCSDDFYCTVQPGVTRQSLNSAIRDTGLWFPIGQLRHLSHTNVPAPHKHRSRS